MKPKFEFLEHVADAYVAAYGRSLEEAFENAALAMFELMTDTEKVEPSSSDSVVIEEYDEKALLYSWLEHLLLRFEIEGKVYAKFRVDQLLRTSKGWKMSATAFGEQFDPARHASKVEVKAVTYHQMEINRENNGYVVKFILDL
jgi:SHS2 domain-containing protein